MKFTHLEGPRKQTSSLIKSIHFDSVVLDASSISFQYYTDGIYYDTDCNQSGLNHAMLVVGYGTDSNSGVDYWILKNRLVEYYYTTSTMYFSSSTILQLGQVLGTEWLHENCAWEEHVWHCNCSNLPTNIDSLTLSLVIYLLD